MRFHRIAAIPLVGLAAIGVTPTPTAAGGHGVVTLAAGLNGAREIPGPGDRNGSGLARVTVDTATGEICYSLTVRNIAPATAAHIHEASRHQAGGVVQPLAAPSDGTSSGCVVNADLAAALDADPAAFYVNVHNAEFPAGAVRGQLAGG